MYSTADMMWALSFIPCTPLGQLRQHVKETHSQRCKEDLPDNWVNNRKVLVGSGT